MGLVVELVRDHGGAPYTNDVYRLAQTLGGLSSEGEAAQGGGAISCPRAGVADRWPPGRAVAVDQGGPGGLGISWDWPPCWAPWSCCTCSAGADPRR